MVELSTVNRAVVGSSPTPRAKQKCPRGIFCFAWREHQLLDVRVGLEDRSDMRVATSIARGGLRVDRVADEEGLVGESHPQSII